MDREDLTKYLPTEETVRRVADRERSEENLRHAVETARFIRFGEPAKAEAKPRWSPRLKAACAVLAVTVPLTLMFSLLVPHGSPKDGEPARGATTSLEMVVAGSASTPMGSAAATSAAPTASAAASGTNAAPTTDVALDAGAASVRMGAAPPPSAVETATPSTRQNGKIAEPNGTRPPTHPISSGAVPAAPSSAAPVAPAAPSTVESASPAASSADGDVRRPGSKLPPGGLKPEF